MSTDKTGWVQTVGERVEPPPFRPRWWFWLALAGIILAVVGAAYVPQAATAWWQSWADHYRAEGYAAGLAAGQQAAGAKSMADYTVTGAGDATYNGTYVESGIYNGKPAYTLDATHWLWWESASSFWALSAAKGDGLWQYKGLALEQNLPANPWEVALGTPPAPTVNAVATYNITGLVTRWGSPLSGVLMTARKDALERTDTTGVDGTFSIADCEDGYWLITPTLAGFHFQPVGKYRTVAGADVSAGTFRAASNTNYDIEGTVTRDAAPLAGVTVTATAHPGQPDEGYVDAEDTAADGTYTLVDRIEGRHLVVPTLLGSVFQPAGRFIIVMDGDVTGVNFTSNTGAPENYLIEGRVVTVDALGLAGVTINLTGDATDSTTTDANGYYSFDGIDNGDYVVTPVPALGFTFSPTSRSVTINGAISGGNNFTANEVTMATAAYGTILQYAGPPLLPIGELTHISGASIKQDVPDVTSHDSDLAYREFVGALLDAGEVNFEGNHIAGDLGQQRIMTHFNARDLRAMLIDMPDGSQWQFNALSVGISPAGAPVDGKLDFSGVYKISGKPVLATAFSNGLTTPFFSLAATVTGAVSPNPAAAGTTYAYTAALVNGDTWLKVTPTAATGSPVIQVGKTGAMAVVASGAQSGEIAMSVGANTVYIAVQTAGTKRRLYTIVATRAAA